MHVVIINGSPRVKQFSNTDKIIQSFGKGLEENGCTYELYTLSNRREWDAAREAFIKSDRIIIALPLFVESAPSLMLEWLDTLPTERQHPAELSFILQSGFAEACQLRCGEQFLKSLPAQLGCNYGGCLIKGGNFGIRIVKGKDRDKILKPYIAMGRSYATKGNFITPEARKFTGPETFPWLIRKLIMLVFRFFENKVFEKAAKEWGCTQPLDYKAY